MVDAYLFVLNAGFLKAPDANFPDGAVKGIYGNNSDILKVENTRWSGGQIDRNTAALQNGYLASRESQGDVGGPASPDNWASVQPNNTKRQ